VFNRLIKKGAESQAKLVSLREQLQEQSTRHVAGHMPKINDKSRSIVEATRRNSTTNKPLLTPCSSFTTSLNDISKEEEPLWKEHATDEVSSDASLYSTNTHHAGILVLLQQIDQANYVGSAERAVRSLSGAKGSARIQFRPSKAGAFLRKNVSY
jgi:hypothetical protein